MVNGSLRYFGCAVGFGFGAVWMTAGLGSAILCVFLAAVGYGVVFASERAQRHSPKPVRVDEFEADDATSPLAAESEYGWPLRDPELAGTTAT